MQNEVHGKVKKRLVLISADLQGVLFNLQILAFIGLAALCSLVAGGGLGGVSKK